jgi:ribonuclease HI
MATTHAGTPSLAELTTQPQHTLTAPERTRAQSSTQGMTLSMQQVPRINRYRVTVPALLQGHMCYVDASTTPDQPNQQPSLAGLGVFILNLQEQPTQAMYIKAKLHACTSVIMAEAAALALASVIIDKLNITGVNFLSDSEQLVHFLNKEDLSNPPDWRIKPFTQLFLQPCSNQRFTEA